MSENLSANSPRRLLVPVLAVVALLLAVGLGWWLAGGSHDDDTAPVSAAPYTHGQSQGTDHQVPARVQRTLAKIDAGQWPPADAPGTSGGRTFRNNEGRLPSTGANGKPLTFQEWDVNAKKSGQGRDAERIITASDGSAWYTLDHYQTFIQIRGPSHG
ncbi:MAG: ribonuclease domain-containing protein [Gordonia sp. (in: high G+C Gram-positive bacteria)]|uniref:ribonuclease domain-containing protein n=1 Tax=Gordonia sp. (in: high G+C Gram-positive bacteria) TaxID=84139 RepID=UPI0039E38C9C